MHVVRNILHFFCVIKVCNFAYFFTSDVHL